MIFPNLALEWFWFNCECPNCQENYENNKEGIWSHMFDGNDNLGWHYNL